MILHFVDTETTGLETDDFEPEVISYAIVRLEAGCSTVIRHRYLTPSIPPTPEVCAINGYSLEKWRELNEGEEPPFFDMTHAAELQHHLDGAIIVGSNPDFDKRRLQYECRQLGVPTPTWHHRSINLSSFAVLLHVANIIPGAGLSDAAAYFGLDVKGRHTALGDCMIGIQIFEAFTKAFITQPRAMRDALQIIANGTVGDGDQMSLRRFAAAVAADNIKRYRS